MRLEGKIDFPSVRLGVFFGLEAEKVGLSEKASGKQGSVTDLGRLKKGLDGVNFLLDNWERETTDPISGAQAPDRVRFFLGLRTTDHPLFQVTEVSLSGTTVSGVLSFRHSAV